MVYVHSDPTVEAGVLALVMRERRKARSTQEWKKTLKGYGYKVQKTELGAMIMTLPHGVKICALPHGTAI